MQLDPRTWFAGLDWAEMIDVGAWIAVSTQILVIFGLAWVSHWVLRLLLQRLERSAQNEDPTSATVKEQRVVTLVSLARSVGIVVIATITLFMVLTTFGLEIGPLLAGAGVVGLAISFGAQALVRDLISGLFILFENQFGVGDVIRIGDTAGKVESMTLRIVVMRDIHGVVHTVPNGEITRVSNLTRSFSRAVIDIGVAYKEDAENVIGVMRDVGAGLWNDPDWRPILLEEPVVPGIESFGDSAVNIRMMATTLPLKQWDVARELRMRLKSRFDREGIEIPYPHTTLYWGPDQKPAQASPAGSAAAVAPESPIASKSPSASDPTGAPGLPIESESPMESESPVAPEP